MSDPREELASIYDEIAELTATTDMSGGLQPQFVARMLGAEPAEVVALRSLRRRLATAPDDPELAAEAERSLGAARELLAAAEGYAARETQRRASTPTAEQPMPATVATAAGDAREAAEADELECLSYVDAVDWLLETTGAADLPPAERVDALAHALRTPRDRIRAVIDAHAAATDPDVESTVAVVEVRAARPVLDRLVDRAEHGDVHEPPRAEPTTDGDRALAGGWPARAAAGTAAAGVEHGGLDELSRLARERVDIPTTGGLVRTLLIVVVVLAVVAAAVVAVLIAAG